MEFAKASPEAEPEMFADVSRCEQAIANALTAEMRRMMAENPSEHAQRHLAVHAAAIGRCFDQIYDLMWQSIGLKRSQADRERLHAELSKLSLDESTRLHEAISRQATGN